MNNKKKKKKKKFGLRLWWGGGGGGGGGTSLVGLNCCIQFRDVAKTFIDRDREVKVAKRTHRRFMYRIGTQFY